MALIGRRSRLTRWMSGTTEYEIEGWEFADDAEEGMEDDSIPKG